MNHSAMNHLYKCFLSLLLIVMITTKLVVPAMQLYKSSSQSDIEQEQKTSEENSTEKTDAEKAKTEIAELGFAQRFISSHVTVISLYNSYFVSLLPARYFAVPTPPPWYSC